MPQIASNKRYAGNSGWTVSECAEKVAKDIGKIDILVGGACTHVMRIHARVHCHGWHQPETNKQAWELWPKGLRTWVVL